MTCYNSSALIGAIFICKKSQLMLGLDFLWTVSSIDLISLKIQIVDVVQIPIGKVLFSFHFHILHKKLNIETKIFFYIFFNHVDINKN